MMDGTVQHTRSVVSDFIRETLGEYPDLERLAVGYSGGTDSSVLLHALHLLRDQGILTLPLRAIHINHSITAEAARWQRHCRDQCGNWRVPLVEEVLQADAVGTVNREASARTARYRAVRKHLGEGDLLLLAHHLDDQLETFFLRLCRGSGAAGLAAMPAVRQLGPALLARPLLTVPRSELQHYARYHNLHCIEDPSNSDLSLDRNFLRHQLLPQIEQRWPGYRKVWSRAVRLNDEANSLNRLLASQDLAKSGTADSSIDCSSLLSLSDQRARNLLRHWLLQQGLQLPGESCMKNFLHCLHGSKPESNPQMHWSAGSVRRYRGRLYAMPPLPPLPPQRIYRWQPPQTLVVPGMGELSARPVSGGGLLADGCYSVQFRKGGESCRAKDNGHSQSLKKLFQERSVPPWIRDRIPLIYNGELLVAVGNLAVSTNRRAGPGQAGWSMDWVPPAGCIWPDSPASIL